MNGRIVSKCIEKVAASTHQARDLARNDMAASQPENLWRRTIKTTALGKIRILRNDTKTPVLGIIPNLAGTRPLEPSGTDVFRTWREISEPPG